MQELWLAIKQVRPARTQRLGRPPSPEELAAEVGGTVAELEQALDVNDGCTALSLDGPFHGEDGGETTLYEQLDAPDPRIAPVEDRASLWPAVSRLPDRDRTILLMRFFGNHSQGTIADELGISQMHVSRLLRSACARLRQELLAETDRHHAGH